MVVFQNKPGISNSRDGVLDGEDSEGVSRQSALRRKLAYFEGNFTRNHATGWFKVGQLSVRSEREWHLCTRNFYLLSRELTYLL